ncbi:MAG: T9SS type A sorting domain-containing protein, partial [Sphingobacteriia bacterium]|nr:T9SS type A sorting domain-containing protein [Sphingobacteriia bacterium]
GVQGDGTWFVNGLGNTTQYGYPIDFGDGGSCAISVINPDAFFYSNSTGVIERSDDEGQNTSFNFAGPTSNLFITPAALWESFESENSRDSITFKALQTYYQGDVLLCRSDNAGFGLDAGYPFNYVLEQDSLVAGDSLRIKDIIQSKLFVATHNAVYMTKDAVKFDKDTEWWQIATVATANGSPSCMAYSKDADHLFIGTQTGIIMRIANIALAYNYDRADVASPYCIISTDIIQIPEFTGRFITSVSVDPNNENHLIVTLGNYGNQGYVYRTTNALASPASDIVFTDITSNLPKMPVYSSLIEMNNSSIALIGTEYGVYTTSDLSNPSLTWMAENNGVGMIPVFQIKQQIIYKNEIVIPSEDPTTPPLVYPKVDNWGTIYIATYGRGVFRDDTYEIVGINDPETSGNTVYKTLSVYPNPVNNETTCSFELFQGGDLTLLVYSSDGRLVKEYNAGMVAAGKQTIRLDCSELINGVYIVKVKTGEESFTSKMIVQ